MGQFQNKINVLNADDVSLDVLIEKGLGDYGDTLDEIMQAGGYLKIYDCGSDKYVYRKEMTM